MRNINIKRLKALEARFSNVEIYIMADDGEYETYGLKFKKMGDLKNGDSLKINIGNETTIIIAKTNIKTYCDDEEAIFIEEGEKDIYIEGKIKFEGGINGSSKFIFDEQNPSITRLNVFRTNFITETLKEEKLQKKLKTIKKDRKDDFIVFEENNKVFFKIFIKSLLVVILLCIISILFPVVAIISIGSSVILALIKSSYGNDKALKIEIENNKILIKKLNNKIKYVLDENNIEKIIVEGILYNLKRFGPINTLNNNRARIQLKNRKCIVLKFAFLGPASYEESKKIRGFWNIIKKYIAKPNLA